MSNDKILELDPMCLRNEISFAVTNRGELIPCCRCDNPKTIQDPEFQKLLAVSKISDYDRIEDILNTEEWIQFESNLRAHKGPPVCRTTCKKDRSKDVMQVRTLLDPSSNKIERQEYRN
jgi:Iron-sulfur cluster-binding domain